MPTSPPIATVRLVPRLVRAHDQVADHYRSEIRRGTYKPGDKFPSVRFIADDWGGISSTTVQRAIAVLKAEGWIEVSQGRVATVVGVPGGQK